MAGVHTRALTAPRPIKPTSPRCHSAWQPNPGRGSTYRCGKSVQTTETTSLGQNATNIYLLTNNNSPAFHQYESNNWNSAGTLLVSYVCDGAGNNDPAKFSWD